MTTQQLALTEDRIDAEFRAWHRAHPETYRDLACLAREWLAAGHNRVGIGALFEVLRWQKGLAGDGTFALNNNFRAPYARLLMSNEPDLDGVFEVRALRRRDVYLGDPE